MIATPATVILWMLIFSHQGTIGLLRSPYQYQAACEAAAAKLKASTSAVEDIYCMRIIVPGKEL